MFVSAVVTLGFSVHPLASTFLVKGGGLRERAPVKKKPEVHPVTTSVPTWALVRAAEKWCPCH